MESKAIASVLAAASNRASAVVAMLDIRGSTTFMLHQEDFHAYAQELANFIGFVRHLVLTSGGWFDKFTGDGALVFWIEQDLSTKSLEKILNVLLNLQQNFIQVSLPNWRQSAGCVPDTFGLAIGVDYGKVLLSDLYPAPMIVSGAKLNPEPATRSVTVLGRAVVGAARMTTAARAHQVLLNEGPGELLFRSRSFLGSEAHVRRVMVQNKDLPDKQQFGYRFSHDTFEEALRRHFVAES